MSDESKTNVLQLFGGSKVGIKNKADTARLMKQSASLDPRANGDIDYLSFSGKIGKYALGKDKEDIDPDELWLVNIHSFKNGWICWKAGRPVAKRLAMITEPQVLDPDPDEFGPFTSQNDGWYRAKSFVLKSLETGVTAEFTTNSKSGVSVFAGIEDQIADRMVHNMADWPVITMDKELFTVDGNTNYKPKIDVLGWMTDDSVARLDPEAEYTQEDVEGMLSDNNPDGSSDLPDWVTGEDEKKEGRRPERSTSRAAPEKANRPARLRKA
jgi:hypothetical protein